MAAWVQLGRSFTWYLFAIIVSPLLLLPAYAPDAWLLVALVLTGTWTGAWARQMRQWPCFILVPSLSQRLFTLILIAMVATTLAVFAVSWNVGGSLPPVGPAMLLGLLMAYCCARRLAWRLIPILVILVPIFLAISLDFKQFAGHPWLEALSHIKVQIPTLVMAVVLAVALKPRLAAPAAKDWTNTPISLTLSRTTFMPSFSQGYWPAYIASGWRWPSSPCWSQR